MNHGNKLGTFISLERRLKTESIESRITEFDQDLWRNHQVNKREISEIKNHEKLKLKLKLTKIMI